MCLILSKTQNQNISHLSGGELVRNLGEEVLIPLLNQSDKNIYHHDEFHFDGHYNSIHGANNFFDFLKYQRYSFFSKVESDYLDEPENETLQIFKPDDNYTDEKSLNSIEEKLKREKLKESKLISDEEYFKQKSKKYSHIESIV